MPDLVVFEDAAWSQFLPLAYWRALFDLRCGLDTLLDKIESACAATAALAVRAPLAEVVSARRQRPLVSADAQRPRLYVNGRALVRQPIDLPLGSATWSGDALVAAHVQAAVANRLTPAALLDPAATRAALAGARDEPLPAEAIQLIDYPWQLYHANAAEICRQAARLRPGVSTAVVYPGAHLVGGQIHLAPGVRVLPGAVLDAEPGPIVVAPTAGISANASVQGPCFIGENGLVQPTTILRGGVTLGPSCKVGGELEGVIFQGFSNKQHHGFLGHSYVGEWVNLGAGTVNSDLKNTYGRVQVPVNGRLVDTGQTFIGALIGDHAKTGINTVLPTGCVVGFAANVFCSRHAPRFVPSFAWLTDEGLSRNDPAKALAVARTMAARRKISLSTAEERLFTVVAELAGSVELGD
ncbi:MAG: putative sugar nucleotidyl transferase [Phycisphaerae bacterium]